MARNKTQDACHIAFYVEAREESEAIIKYPEIQDLLQLKRNGEAQATQAFNSVMAAFLSAGAKKDVPHTKRLAPWALAIRAVFG